MLAEKELQRHDLKIIGADNITDLRMKECQTLIVTSMVLVTVGRVFGAGFLSSGSLRRLEQVLIALFTELQ